MRMYRVTVKSSGKYNNVAPGSRYCFTKRSVIHLAATFAGMECDFNVEKFIRLNSDIFTWSYSGVNKKIWEKIYEVRNKGRRGEG